MHLGLLVPRSSVYFQFNLTIESYNKVDGRTGASPWYPQFKVSSLHCSGPKLISVNSFFIVNVVNAVNKVGLSLKAQSIQQINRQFSTSVIRSDIIKKSRNKYIVNSPLYNELILYMSEASISNDLIKEKIQLNIEKYLLDQHKHFMMNKADKSKLSNLSSIYKSLYKIIDSSELNLIKLINNYKNTILKESNNKNSIIICEIDKLFSIAQNGLKDSNNLENIFNVIKEKILINYEKKIFLCFSCLNST